MIYKALDYKSREELESAIAKESGLTTELKTHTIEGTKKELKNLHLSADNIVWGIKVVETDADKTPKVKNKDNDKIDRGQIYKGGINKNKNG